MIGMSLPMTGAGFNAVGRELTAAIRLYTQQHGDTIAGRKIEITIPRNQRLCLPAGEQSKNNLDIGRDTFCICGRLQARGAMP
jgi:hypothetical protein